MDKKADQLAQEMTRFEQEILNSGPGPVSLFPNSGAPPGPPPGAPPRPLLTGPRGPPVRPPGPPPGGPAQQPMRPPGPPPGLPHQGPVPPPPPGNQIRVPPPGGPPRGPPRGPPLGEFPREFRQGPPREHFRPPLGGPPREQFILPNSRPPFRPPQGGPPGNMIGPPGNMIRPPGLQPQLREHPPRGLPLHQSFQSSSGETSHRHPGQPHMAYPPPSHGVRQALLRPMAQPATPVMVAGAHMQKMVPSQESILRAQAGYTGLSIVPQRMSTLAPAPVVLPLPIPAASKHSSAGAEAIDPEAVSLPRKRPKQMKMKRDPKKLRMGGGKVWEDHSLDDWDQDDFRIFVGDLGNDVNDDTLARSFSKYSSFTKAKVIRDKYTKKTKGFGFVSFKNPQDFMQAMREMNGRYIGNRPVKLRKSTWKDRGFEVVKKKEKEKKRLGFK